MRSTRLFPWLLCVGLLATGFAMPAAAQDDDAAEEDDFDTSWFGARLGFWYHPEMEMSVQVGGQPAVGESLTRSIGEVIDIKNDLGVRESPHSEYLVDFDQEAILDLQLFFQTRLVSVYAWLVAPYEYRGIRTLDRVVEFGGTRFPLTAEVESRFRQWMAGVDVTINIFNNRFFQISPLVGARVLAVDWEITVRAGAGGLSQGTSGDTSDIDAPTRAGEYQVLPYPEVGADVRFGYRDFIEVGVILAGSWIEYYGMEGGTFRGELFATLYPIPFVGVQLGVRYLTYDLSATDNNPFDHFDFNLEFFGANAGVILRFG